MGSRMEQFEQIRRDRDREGLSIRALAERHGVHRRAVRQALASPLPPAKRAAVGRPAPRLGPYRALIDGWLEADREAPRKQRHTARRVWRGSSTSTAPRSRRRRCVSTCVVGSARWAGRSGRCSCRRCMTRVWVRRSTGARPRSIWRRCARRFICSSCARRFRARRSVKASLVETQQAFLELHVEAFEWFGGVFAQVRYDNLTSAVKRVLRGRRRVESDRFVALRSHYLFASAFTRPGIEGAHEKGGVEGEVGRFRRNHLVPVPAFASMAELNAFLLEGCEADLGRRIVGRAVTVGEAWAWSGRCLRPLPGERFDAAETASPRVDAKSLVTVRQNRYSVPVRLAGLRVSVRIGAREITVSHAGELVARHERLQGRYGTSAPLDHYLELLERKPGGLQHSLALRQERERGGWPGCFDELWAALTVRYGSSEAARQMVDVLLLSREHDPGRVELAVQGALAAGAHDGRAVAVLARRADATGGPHRLLEQLEPRLAAHARPAPDLAPYDQLIGGSR